MQLKKYFALTLAVLLLMALVGCGRSDSLPYGQVITEFEDGTEKSVYPAVNGISIFSDGKIFACFPSKADALDFGYGVWDLTDGTLAYIDQEPVNSYTTNGAARLSDAFYKVYTFPTTDARLAQLWRIDPETAQCTVLHQWTVMSSMVPLVAMEDQLLLEVQMANVGQVDVYDPETGDYSTLISKIYDPETHTGAILCAMQYNKETGEIWVMSQEHNGKTFAVYLEIYSPSGTLLKKIHTGDLFLDPMAHDSGYRQMAVWGEYIFLRSAYSGFGAIARLSGDVLVPLVSMGQGRMLKLSGDGATEDSQGVPVFLDLDRHLLFLELETGTLYSLDFARRQQALQVAGLWRDGDSLLTAYFADETGRPRYLLERASALFAGVNAIPVTSAGEFDLSALYAK